MTNTDFDNQVYFWVREINKAIANEKIASKDPAGNHGALHGPKKN